MLEKVYKCGILEHLVPWVGENGLKTLNVSESMIDMNETYSQWGVSVCGSRWPLREKVQCPASFFYLFVFVQPLQVDNISSFQKVSGDFTIPLCLFPGLGDNIHCIFVAYESCHHHILLVLMFRCQIKTQTDRGQCLSYSVFSFSEQMLHLSAPERTASPSLPEKTLCRHRP